MICQHASIKEARYGQTDECILCHQPIVFDGKKWRWQYDLGIAKVRKMERARDMDRYIDRKMQDSDIDALSADGAQE